MRINKMFGILGIILFLSASIIAVDVLSKEREVSDEDFDIATSKEIDTYNRSDTFGEDIFYRKLISKSDFKLPTSPRFKTYNIVCTSWNKSDESEWVCLDEVRVNKTLEEQKAELQVWEVEAMELILRNIEKREIVDLIVSSEESEVVLTKSISIKG